ncbi:RNA-binding protein [Schizosaccharomyces japonicus yFS275]|uniref:RNA-binding protein n=1 Tax=Schizosaccharomyces japonicus (strain yFS275 / FY16936) TaxID=402676 RepID=B6K1X6_SCHJY|nr:RNA-binding protein [Schizosaccharomyces japonicus yFS275]EEB07157.1 RNA-binding protein [Schizosaccharomyces japonicus yFS275]
MHEQPHFSTHGVSLLSKDWGKRPGFEKTDWLPRPLGPTLPEIRNSLRTDASGFSSFLGVSTPNVAGTVEPVDRYGRGMASMHVLNQIPSTPNIPLHEAFNSSLKLDERNPLLGSSNRLLNVDTRNDEFSTFVRHGRAVDAKNLGASAFDQFRLNPAPTLVSQPSPAPIVPTTPSKLTLPSPPPLSSMHLSSPAAQLQKPPPIAITPFSILQLSYVQILALCHDQLGCRSLQRVLESNDPLVIDKIFRTTYEFIPNLMVDAFGNYLCQKLFEHANDFQRTAFVKVISSKLVPISLNMHGTRALQKVLELVSLPEQIDCVVKSLQNNVVLLIKDLNGNHVIQKCLNQFSSEDSQFIYSAICRNIVEVSTHRHGCCVVQRCFDHASPAQREMLVLHIIPVALELVQDAFGNYVVQYVLDLKEPVYTDAVIRKFLHKVRMLSVQKFSSNVMEKSLSMASDELRALLIDELLDKKHLSRLLKDQFANYVVQTALECASPEQRAKMFASIKPLMSQMKNIPCARRVLAKMERYSVASS